MASDRQRESRLSLPFVFFRLPPDFRRAARLIAVVLAMTFCVPALAQSSDKDEASPLQPAEAKKPDESLLPKQELTEPVLLGLLLAEIAAQRDNPAYAARTYLELAKRTLDPRVARRAAEIANYARLPDVALDAAKIWYEAEPESTRALQTISGLLISTRRVEEAVPYLAKLFGTDTVAAANGFMQVNRFLSSNPDRKANLAVIRKLVEGHPNLPQAHFAIAQAAAVADEDVAALEAVRRAAQLKPDWDLAAIFEAQLLQPRFPAEAQTRLSEYLRVYPGSREAGLNYARLLVLDKKLPEARAQFKVLLAAYPESADVLYAVGLLSAQLKDYAEAEAYLSKLLETTFRDKSSVRMTLGRLAEERKDYPAALKWYARIEAGDQFITSRLRTAHVLFKQGNLDAARAYLRKVDAGGQQVQMLIGEAQLLREANQNAEAFKVLNQALEAQPDQPDLLYDRALTAEKLERFDVLEADLTRLIAISPERAHAYNALGYSFADRNVRLDEARTLIEKAMKLAPEDLFIVDSMGWTYYRLGDLSRAKEYLSRAWEGRPDGEIGAHLGEVLWVMGERAEAERIWQEAEKKSPDNEALKKTIKRLKNP
jgi:tetratricopeptide (TPR) repeat protein